MAHAQFQAGLMNLRDAFRTYCNIGFDGVNYGWFQNKLERGLREIDGGLFWMLGGFQPNPDPHLTSSRSVGLSRLSLNLLILISRKMPIHTRVMCSIQELKSLLLELSCVISNDATYLADVNDSFHMAEAEITRFFSERFRHPWDYATVSFCF